MKLGRYIKSGLVVAMVTAVVGVGVGVAWLAPGHRRRKVTTEAEVMKKCFKTKRFVSLGERNVEYALHDLQELTDGGGAVITDAKRRDEELLKTAGYATITLPVNLDKYRNPISAYHRAKHLVQGHIDSLRPGTLVAVHTVKGRPMLRRVFSLLSACLGVGLLEPNDIVRTVVWMICSGRSDAPWLPGARSKCLEKHTLETWSKTSPCETVADAAYCDRCTLRHRPNKEVLRRSFLIVSRYDAISNALAQKGLTTTTYTGLPESSPITPTSSQGLVVVLLGVEDEVSSWKAHLEPCNATLIVACLEEGQASSARGAAAAASAQFIDAQRLFNNSACNYTFVDVLLSAVGGLLLPDFPSAEKGLM